MTIIRKLILWGGCAFALAGVLPAAVPTGTVIQNIPGQISYQGVLANPVTGELYPDGEYTLDVRIWNTETRKTGCLWGAKYVVRTYDGHFSLILGDASAAKLEAEDGEQPQYAKGELWKALWGETAEDTERYLGITPHEDTTGIPVSVLTEISPRHQLLASPFAFRAVKAQYADGARADFNVGGKMTVNGSATFSGGLNAPNTALTQRIGPISTSGSAVCVGGETSATKAGLPNIYSVGYTLLFMSYGDLNIGSTAGNTTFTVPSGKHFLLQGDGAFVSTAALNTIGGSGSTRLGGSQVVLQSGGNIRYEQNPNDVTISGGSRLGVEMNRAYLDCTTDNAVMLQGTSADLQGLGNNGGQWQSLISVGDNVISGAGYLKWNMGHVTDSPIVYRHVTISLPGTSWDKWIELNTLLPANYISDYKWMIGTWKSIQSGSVGYGLRTLRVTYDNQWLFIARNPDNYGTRLKISIMLVGYAHKWM